MVGVGVFLLIANLASKERVIPELMSAGGRSDVESFDTLTSMATGSTQAEVNPTTASIITSILGEQATADQQQVNSAIDTLSSGEFGASVRRTMEEVEAANQTTKDQREALHTDEETGQTMERVWSNPFLSLGVRTSHRPTWQVFLDLNPTVSLSLRAWPAYHCQPLNLAHQPRLLGR